MLKKKIFNIKEVKEYNEIFKNLKENIYNISGSKKKMNKIIKWPTINFSYENSVKLLKN